MKIYIVGSVGSGKTTLARKVATLLKVQHYETDNFVWTRHITGDIRNGIDVRDQLFEEAMRSPHWVIEGVHIDWTDAAILNADQIIFLDIPLKIRTWRIIKRYILQMLKLEKSNYKPTFTIFKKMFGWNIYFEQHMKPKFLESFEPHKEKVVQLKTNYEVVCWVKQIKEEIESK